MSDQQKKLQKRKARERVVRTRLRVKREVGRRKAKADRQEALEQDRDQKVVNQRIQLEQWAATIGDRLSPEVRSQVEHNIEILKALEDEHAAEVSKKKRLKDLLERSGHTTLPEMMSAVQEADARRRSQEEIIDYQDGVTPESHDLQKTPPQDS